jgi:uncharacterized membrane protein
MNLYHLLEFVHVAAAMAWIGGALTLGVLSARTFRSEDGAALLVLSEQAEFVGRSVLGPSAVVTLVAGISLVYVAGWGLTLWTAWGLAGIVVSMFLGARVIAPAHRHLAAVAATSWPDPRSLIGARRRVAAWGTLNLVVLLSVVWAMVAKPTL